ncbi:hypothetical protein KATP_21180 [Kluyvera ascorbata]|nr:hypothetical protein KATP_21180 [Kluyvera ascorbata]
MTAWVRSDDFAYAVTQLKNHVIPIANILTQIKISSDELVNLVWQSTFSTASQKDAE